MMGLPDKPSELVEIGLRDLELCEQDPKYVIMMSKWHEPIIDFSGGKKTVCAVCLAGAVMAKTMRTPPNERVHPFTQSGNDVYKLMALDNFRTGEFSDAFVNLDIVDQPDIDFEPRLYSNDPDGFKEDMRKLIDKLKKAGL